MWWVSASATVFQSFFAHFRASVARISPKRFIDLYKVYTINNIEEDNRQIYSRMKSAVRIGTINGMWLTWLNMGIWSAGNFKVHLLMRCSQMLTKLIRIIKFAECAKSFELFAKTMTLIYTENRSIDSLRNRMNQQILTWNSLFFCMSLLLPPSLSCVAFELNGLFFFGNQRFYCDGHCNR